MAVAMAEGNTESKRVVMSHGNKIMFSVIAMTPGKIMIFFIFILYLQGRESLTNTFCFTLSLNWSHSKGLPGNLLSNKCKNRHLPQAPFSCPFSM